MRPAQSKPTLFIMANETRLITTRQAQLHIENNAVRAMELQELNAGDTLRALDAPDGAALGSTEILAPDTTGTGDPNGGNGQPWSRRFGMRFSDFNTGLPDATG